MAAEAAEPLGVAVFPVLAYGITPYFRAFPGSITLRPSTEWVDTVRVGANTLADAGDLAEVLDRAAFPADAPPLYGDGHTAARISDTLYTLRPS